MKNQTENFIEMWKEARTRFSNLLNDISANDLSKKLEGKTNSVGFLIRHIAEVELLFAKNVFGANNVKVTAKTIIDGKDTGVWTDKNELKDIAKEAYDALLNILEVQTDEDWQDTITTKEFGTKTKAEAFGRIVSHTAYHAGQIAIILKYGN